MPVCMAVCVPIHPLGFNLLSIRFARHLLQHSDSRLVLIMTPAVREGGRMWRRCVVVQAGMREVPDQTRRLLTETPKTGVGSEHSVA